MSEREPDTPSAEPFTQTTSDESDPKTTRPEAVERREQAPAVPASESIGRQLDAVPDRVDARDLLYQPRLGALPDQLVNCGAVPEILDQGTEGACTGFALAAVINYLVAGRDLRRSVSPRMLYELARRYDEWPGEEYAGSSARGAMKGWVRHGVCTRDEWPDDRTGIAYFTPDVVTQARATPGGAFYRVSHRDVRDMHAALVEVGALYVTLMVHEGWGQPGPMTRTVGYTDASGPRTLELPIIQRKGRADGGHAVAIVGYTVDGFIIQNSWGASWGAGGFALLPYEDYMLHATDVWVAQLGVPIKIDLWELGAADTPEGRHRATRAIPLAEIRPYIVDLGNNGELSDSGDYWTTEADLHRLFSETIPEATKGWSKKRVLLYLHGGLNDEKAVASRVVAYRDVLLKNEIYPLHIMWESGFSETLNDIIRDVFTDVDERAGDWLARFREGLLEARDRTLELTVARPGSALWAEMKENARLASFHSDGKGGMQILLKHAREALATLDEAGRSGWELHVVGHSAGCIYSGHALPHLLSLGVSFRTLQLMAPAMRVDDFKGQFLQPIRDGACPRPTLYVLSEVGELDDDVGPYGKSLLYLVSNAFEGRRETPLLGMKHFLDRDPELSSLFGQPVDGRPGLVVAGAVGAVPDPASTSRSSSHGGFDNDRDTLNSVLFRILGRRPDPEFTTRDLQY
jgi:Papain family cysteine protease